MKRTTSLLVLTALSVFAAKAEAQDNGWSKSKVKHVLLISIDGMHAVDYLNCSQGIAGANDGKPFWWVGDVPAMPFESIVFDPVPEPKTVKNRIHWDLYGDVGELLAHGATHLWDRPNWTVLADPEGNEFCVFPEPA